MGFIYWIDAAPNPWVRAIAIAVIGTYYYFYGSQAPEQQYWEGPYGVCTSDRLNNSR